MGTEKFTDKPDGGQDKKYPKTVMETILKVNKVFGPVEKCQMSEIRW